MTFSFETRINYEKGQNYFLVHVAVAFFASIVLIRSDICVPPRCRCAFIMNKNSDWATEEISIIFSDVRLSMLQEQLDAQTTNSIFFPHLSE